MKSILILLLLIFVIVVSGCIENPTKQVPVVHANITLAEKEGVVNFESYKLVQGTVNYLGRPRTEQAETFPAISARTVILKGENSTIGPWENLPYKGSGTYSFDIGFTEGKYPASKDNVNIYIYVWDEKGNRIGFISYQMIWN